jgi:hypothetical protein
VNPSLGSANRVYISLPDTSASCASWTGLPPLPSGWSYVCSTQANFRRVNGTGWIPVDFTASTVGAPFSSLPIDPTNNVSYYYTYITGGSWNLTALMESNHQPVLKQAINDGGAMPGVFELGTNTKLGPFTRDKGLVGFWRFEEGTGTTANDSSGNQNTGTLSGVGWTTGKVGTAANFSSDTSNMTVAITPILNTDTHTISFWMRPIAQGGGHTQVLAYRPPGTERSPGIWICPSSQPLGFHWKYDPGNTGTGCAGPSGENTSFSTSTWYHIAGVKSGSSLIIYVNGVVSVSKTVANPKVAGNASLVIGQTSFNSALLAIDEVRIYNRALSADEISAIYGATK